MGAEGWGIGVGLVAAVASYIAIDQHLSIDQAVIDHNQAQFNRTYSLSASYQGSPTKVLNEIAQRRQLLSTFEGLDAAVCTNEYNHQEKLAQTMQPEYPHNALSWETVLRTNERFTDFSHCLVEYRLHLQDRKSHYTMENMRATGIGIVSALAVFLAASFVGGTLERKTKQTALTPNPNT